MTKISDLDAIAGTDVATTDTLVIVDVSDTTMAASGTNKELEVGGLQAVPLAINAQTGTSYTLVLTDAGKLVTLTNAAAITLTIPLNSSVAYSVGTTIDLAQLGAGQVTITPTGGVTVNGTPGLKHRAQYSATSVIKTATDTWLAVGDLAA